MSNDRIYAAVVRVAQERLGRPASVAAAPASTGVAPAPAAAETGSPALSEHLDIGAGRGELIGELARRLPVHSYACDFHVERFAAPGVECVQCNFDRAPLPYGDDRFDLVTSSEVIEHLENFRNLLREAYRVARPGGVVILTTPNVLNTTSRARYVVSGFANLFGPLPVRNDKLYSTGGHITPIGLFYLAHALLDAGFADIRVDIDKVQKTSVAWAVLLWPFIALGRWRFFARERGKYRTITPENEPFVSLHFSWPVLLGRTIVVSAVKPAAAAAVAPAAVA